MCGQPQHPLCSGRRLLSLTLHSAEDIEGRGMSHHSPVQALPPATIPSTYPEPPSRPLMWGRSPEDMELSRHPPLEGPGGQWVSWRRLGWDEAHMGGPKAGQCLCGRLMRLAREGHGSSWIGGTRNTR